MGRSKNNKKTMTISKRVSYFPPEVLASSQLSLCSAPHCQQHLEASPRQSEHRSSLDLLYQKHLPLPEQKKFKTSKLFLLDSF